MGIVNKLTDAMVGFRGLALESIEKTPTYGSQLAMTLPASGPVETLSWMADLPMIREWVGDKIVRDMRQEHKAVTIRDYEITLGIKRNDLDDDRLGIYRPRIQMAAVSAVKGIDRLLVRVLEANPVGFDGVTLFNNNHPLDPALGGAVNDNDLGAGALDPTQFQAGMALLRGMRGWHGQELDLVTSPPVLLVPPALESTALAVVEAQLTTGGASNINYGRAKVVVCPYLTQAAVFYLLVTDLPIRPLVLLERRPWTQVDQLGPDAEPAFMRGEYLFSMEGRYGMAEGPYFLAVRGGV